MHKKSNQKGFTIIEVLIVLAIAALIMLVVFLAVPALRRSAANSSRANDAAKVSAAVTDCLSNRNGDLPSCSTVANIDASNLSQLIFDATNTTFSTAASPTAAALAAPTSDTDAVKMRVTFYAKCSDDGASAIATSNKRDFVVLYNKKTTSSVTPVCIGS